ncbi:MAG: DUF2584 family protein [Synechococcales cyanobacterium RM1_1_8]|nr:DUF2584 family protein [Synechococcales cyanobacterium RM1_1_8]
MGMPCEFNAILKLTAAQGYPGQLSLGQSFQARKSGYRLFVMDVPLQLVDSHWQAWADVTIRELRWCGGETLVRAEVVRLYDRPFCVK